MTLTALKSDKPVALESSPPREVPITLEPRDQLTLTLKKQEGQVTHFEQRDELLVSTVPGRCRRLLSGAACDGEHAQADTKTDSNTGGGARHGELLRGPVSSSVGDGP